MAYGSRSPHVVSAHFFARYGYDEAVSQISSKLTAPDQADHSFWTKVLDELDVLQADEAKGVHPCAALPPKPRAQLKRNKASTELS